MGVFLGFNFQGLLPLDYLVLQTIESLETTAIGLGSALCGGDFILSRRVCEANPVVFVEIHLVVIRKLILCKRFFKLLAVSEREVVDTRVRHLLR
jgi:hypothetical protein